MVKTMIMIIPNLVRTFFILQGEEVWINGVEDYRGNEEEYKSRDGLNNLCFCFINGRAVVSRRRDFYARVDNIENCHDTNNSGNPTVNEANVGKEEPQSGFRSKDADSLTYGVFA